MISSPTLRKTDRATLQKKMQVISVFLASSLLARRRQFLSAEHVDRFSTSSAAALLLHDITEKTATGIPALVRRNHRPSCPNFSTESRASPHRSAWPAVSCEKRFDLLRHTRPRSFHICKASQAANDFSLVHRNILSQLLYWSTGTIERSMVLPIFTEDHPEGNALLREALFMRRFCRSFQMKSLRNLNEIATHL